MISSRAYASAGAVVLAGLLGLSAYEMTARQSQDAFAQCQGSVVGGQIGGPLNLIDTTGKAVTDKDILAGPTLVYFGYASCPDVCPLDNGRNDQVADALGKQGMKVTPVFISVDPGRDTPEVLADYQTSFSHLRAYTGTPEQIAAAAKGYKVYYSVPDDKKPGYTVDHTTMTYLMLPGKGFVDVFQRDATVQEMTDRTACYLKAS